ncbi:MAG: TRAP transporter small permease [Moraxellaceae bacterium]|nr:TRAP transporter small permease [Moraxellaceae bacterium]
MLTGLVNRCYRLLDWTVAAMLALMVVLVFGNVVLRYAFNSGISVSEELSRWLFVWVTFIGGAVALKENRHLGTDFLVARLPRRLKKLCCAVGYVLMIFACWLVFRGAYDQVVINAGTTSAVMEVPVAWFYASGLVFAILTTLILLRNLFMLLAGRVDDADLVMVQESEDLPHGNPATHDARQA